jgi:hypothetical protein
VETEDGQVKQFTPNPVTASSGLHPTPSHLFFAEMSGLLWVNLEQTNLMMPCEIKGDKVISGNKRDLIFKILEISDSKLVVEQFVINRIALIADHGRRAEFVNISVPGYNPAVQ